MSTSKKKKGQTEQMEVFAGSTIAELLDFLDNNITLRITLGKVMSLWDPSGI